MALDVHFVSRNAAFDPERRVTLTKEGLLRIASAKGETRLPIHEIGLIEIGAETSIASGASYTCQIYRKRAWFPMLTLKSKRYRGPNDFIDQRGAYREFVAALHAQIVASAWPVKTQAAARPAALIWGLYAYGHWALLIWVAVFFVALLGLVMFDPPWAHAIPEVSIALASFAAFGYLSSKVASIRAAFGPWPYDPREIPTSYLPQPLSVD